MKAWPSELCARSFGAKSSPKRQSQSWPGLFPQYRMNICGNSPEDALLIHAHRAMVETVNRQLEKGD